MKLTDWVSKIVRNWREYGDEKIIEANLKAFVQDTDCVKIRITKDNQIYAVVVDDD